MSKLQSLIDRNITNRLMHLNTLMLCEVIKIGPIELLPIFDAKHIDLESRKRTKIQDPLILEGVEVKPGDIVLTGFLQEYVEGGATRKFDLSDAVIIGKVG